MKYTADRFQYKEYRLLAFPMLLSLIMLLLFIFDNNMIFLYGDEFGQWATAAWINGDDWTSITKMMPYYSYLYGILLSVFYRFAGSAEIMYRAAVVFNSIVISSVVLISYRISKSLDKDDREAQPRYAGAAKASLAAEAGGSGTEHKEADTSGSETHAAGYSEADTSDLSKSGAFDPRQLLWIATGFLCAMTSANIVNANLTWAEAFLTFLTWLLFLTAVRLLKDPGTIRTTDLVSFTVLLIAGYAVHQRFIGVTISGMLVLAVLLISRKLNARQVIIIAVLIAAMLAAHILFKHHFREAIYQMSQRGSIGNDYGSAFKSLKKILTWDGFISTMAAFAGQVFYFGVATLLIGYIGVAAAVRKCIGAFRETFRKRNTDTSWLLYAFFLAAFILSFAVSSVFLNVPSRCDHMVYGRYTEFLYGMFILLGWLELPGLLSEIKRPRMKITLICSGAVFLLCSAVAHIRILNSISEKVFYTYPNSSAIAPGKFGNDGSAVVIRMTTFTVLLFIFIIWSIKRASEKCGVKSTQFSRKAAVIIIIASIPGIFSGMYLTGRNIQTRKKPEHQAASSIIEEYNQRSGIGKIVYYSDGDISFESETALSYLQFLMRSEPLVIEPIEIRQGEIDQGSAMDECILSDKDFPTNSNGYAPIAEFSEIVLYSTAQ